MKKKLRYITSTLLAVFFATMCVMFSFSTAKYTSASQYSVMVKEDGELKQRNFWVSPQADRFSIVSIGNDANLNSPNGIKENYVGVQLEEDYDEPSDLIVKDELYVASADTYSTFMSFIMTYFDDVPPISYNPLTPPTVTQPTSPDLYVTATYVGPTAANPAGGEFRTSQSTSDPVVTGSFTGRYIPLNKTEPAGTGTQSNSLGRFEIEIESGYVGEIIVTAAPNSYDEPIVFYLIVDNIPGTVSSLPASGDGDPTDPDDNTYNDAKFFVDNVCWRILSQTMGPGGHDTGFEAMIITEHAYETSQTSSYINNGRNFQWLSTATSAIWYNNTVCRVRASLDTIYQQEMKWAHNRYAISPTTTTFSGIATDATTCAANAPLLSASDNYGLFLLSSSDMQLYGWSGDNTTMNTGRTANYPDGKETPGLWLRSSLSSSGTNSRYAYLVRPNGTINTTVGNTTSNDTYKLQYRAIRPAMLLKFPPKPTFVVAPKADRFSIAAVGAYNSDTNSIKENVVQSLVTEYRVVPTLNSDTNNPTLPTYMTFVTTVTDDGVPKSHLPSNVNLEYSNGYVWQDVLNSGASNDIDRKQTTATIVGTATSYGGDNRVLNKDVGEFRVPIPYDFKGWIKVTVNNDYIATNYISQHPGWAFEDIVFTIYVDTLKKTIDSTPPSNSSTDIQDSSPWGTLSSDAEYDSAKFFVDDMCWRVLSKSIGPTGAGSGNDVLVITEHAIDPNNYNTATSTDHRYWHDSVNTNTTYNNSYMNITTLMGTDGIYQKDLDKWAGDYAVAPSYGSNTGQDNSWANTTNDWFLATSSTRTNNGNSTNSLCFLLSALDVYGGLSSASSTNDNRDDFNPLHYGWNRGDSGTRRPANLSDGTAVALWLRSTSNSANRAQIVTPSGGNVTNGVAKDLTTTGNGQTNPEKVPMAIRPAMLLSFAPSDVDFNVSPTNDRFRIIRSNFQWEKTNRIAENFTYDNSEYYVASLDNDTNLTFTVTGPGAGKNSLTGEPLYINDSIVFDGPDPNPSGVFLEYYDSANNLSDTKTVAFDPGTGSILGANPSVGATGTNPNNRISISTWGTFDVPIPQGFIGTIEVKAVAASEKEVSPGVFEVAEEELTFKINVDNVEATVTGATTSNSAGQNAAGDVIWRSSKAKFFIDNICWRVLANNVGTTGVGSADPDTTYLLISEHALKNQTPWNTSNSGNYRDSTLRTATLEQFFENELIWAHEYAVLPRQDSSWTSTTNDGTQVATSSSGLYVVDPIGSPSDYLDGAFLLGQYDAYRCPTNFYGWRRSISEDIYTYRRAANFVDGSAARLWLRSSRSSTSTDTVQSNGSDGGNNKNIPNTTGGQGSASVPLPGNPSQVASNIPIDMGIRPSMLLNFSPRIRGGSMIIDEKSGALLPAPEGFKQDFLGAMGSTILMDAPEIDGYEFVGASGTALNIQSVPLADLVAMSYEESDIDNEEDGDYEVYEDIVEPEGEVVTFMLNPDVENVITLYYRPIDELEDNEFDESPEDGEKPVGDKEFDGGEKSGVVEYSERHEEIEVSDYGLQSTDPKESEDSDDPDSLDDSDSLDAWDSWDDVKDTEKSEESEESENKELTRRNSRNSRNSRNNSRNSRNSRNRNRVGGGRHVKYY